MTSKSAIDSRVFSPKFDIERRLATSFLEQSNVKIAADVGSDQFSKRAWHPDSCLQLSNEQWLNKYGLKSNNLDSQTLFPKLGFPRLETFNKVLQKPVHSKYADGLFPKHFREDGLTFNIVAKKDRLIQAQVQLENSINLFQQRLDWLRSDSRRLFGVFEEHCITIIIDIKNASNIEFDQFIVGLERLINEQVQHCVKFNLIRVQDSIAQLFPSLMPVSKDNLGLAIDWLWNLNRMAATNPANIVEAMIRASKDKENEAICLITAGNSSDGSREVLREKVKQLQLPFNIVSYNCNDNNFLEYLYCLVTLTGGRFHTYTFNMEIDAYERAPLDDVNPMANLVLKKKVYGGTVGGIGKRKDCVDLFAEMEEAKVILSQIKSLICQIPDKKMPYDDQNEQTSREGHLPKEEYMSSKEWLVRFGLKSRKLDFFDVLGGVCFRHCDGVVEVLEPPPADKIDIMEQQDAIIHQKLVNAKYCDKFAHVRWKDGSLVHVQMSSDVHRLYNERMNICLNAIKRRMEWLRQGSRELFGTIMEEQVYILIDTSASMEPHIGFVKDKMYTLIQEQLRHKSKINFVAFNSKALPWRDRLVDVTESSLGSAWHWIEGLYCQGSTNTLAALQFAIKDRSCQGIYLLTDGRPDQPTKMVLSQIRLQHRLPIHTISFNCADLDANRFLCELARETCGRFHYFNELTGGADCTEEEGFEAWESEDIQVLKAEYRLGTESLEKVTKLRDECHRLAWKREIELQNENKTARKIMLPGCNEGILRDKKPPSRITSPSADLKYSKRIKSRNTFRNQKDDPVWPGSIQLLEFETPRLMNNSGAYFSFLQSLNSKPKGEDDWMLQETKDVLDRQNERFLNTMKEKMKEIDDRKKSASNQKKTKCKELTIKQWLNIYGLIPQHMSILDALAPTIVKVQPKYIPIIDKHVMSKVFDDILPIAHVVTEGSPRKGYKPVVRLVNPLAVDMKGYQNNLEKLLNKYKKKLKKLIKDNIGNNVVEEFEIMTKESPLGSLALKEWILKIFKEANWPVCEDDLERFLKEIYIGHKYFMQAGDLIRTQKKTLGTNDVQEDKSLEVEVSLPVSSIKMDSSTPTVKSRKSLKSHKDFSSRS